MLDAENQHFEFLDALPKKPAPLSFANRVGIAAGFDKHGDYIDALCNLGIGHIEVGSVTRYPREGNPKPRVWRYPEHGSIVNRTGLPSKGIDYVLDRIDAARKKASIGLSIAADTEDDYVYCLRRAATHVDYAAVNVSCPNVSDGQSFQDPAKLKELLAALGPYRSVPIAVKISPDLSNKQLIRIAKVLNTFQVEGVICSNLTHNHEFLTIGGASGKAAKSPSLHTARMMARYCTAKIIASGGILTAQDAQDYFDRGADYVQVFTGLLLNGPQLIEDINRCRH
jgi:dihydroorotate dehydrogenase